MLNQPPFGYRTGLEIGKVWGIKDYGKNKLLINRWNWELDDKRYHDWDQTRLNLLKDNVRIMTYINPHLTDVSNKPYYKKNYF